VITLGTSISLKVHENLLKSIDDIARNLNLTRAEWIRTTLAHAAKKEIAQDKIMDIVATQYQDDKISFDEMVSLVGYENAKRIDAVTKGVETSIKEADALALRLKRK
jgi:antitoxin component of RelBE/YafQ-DinJ toxin-antitoxin module